MTIGERIAKIRKERNLSQEYVAEQLGISCQAVSKWEQDLTAPDTNNLIALSAFLDVSVAYLACGKEEPPPGPRSKPRAPFPPPPLSARFWSGAVFFLWCWACLPSGLSASSAC